MPSTKKQKNKAADLTRFTFLTENVSATAAFAGFMMNSEKTRGRREEEIG
jgi:hypothetical protein